MRRTRARGRGERRQMSTNNEIEERRNRVLELVLENRSMTVENLSSSLSISRMTVRRDLTYLLSRGLIQRIHGGASIPRTGDNEPPYVVRSLEMASEKRAIGATAAAMVKKSEVILLDVGSTMLELVRNIHPGSQAELITHWIPIVLECVKVRNSKVVLLGGEVNLDELVMTGVHTADTLQSYIADTFFMGVGGISTNLGLTDYDMEEIQVKKHMMKRARKVVVLADHSKFERVAPRWICDLDAVQTIVTDGEVMDEQRRAIENAGVELVVAGSSPITASEAPRARRTGQPN